MAGTFKICVDLIPDEHPKSRIYQPEFPLSLEVVGGVLPLKLLLSPSFHTTQVATLVENITCFQGSFRAPNLALLAVLKSLRGSVFRGECQGLPSVCEMHVVSYLSFFFPDSD